MKYVYVASCEKDGGIYRYRLENDRLLLVDKTPCDSPMYMQRENDTLYVLLNAPFEENNESGVITYRIREDGSLTDPTPPVSTRGTVGCHIAVKDGDVYVANYVSGSVCRLGHTLDTHEGHSVHPERQTAPHSHSVVLDPTEKYLLSADLGLDRIFVYDREMALVSTVDAEAGSGPRHMVFSCDGRLLYVINELSSTVTVYRFSNGVLERGKSYPALTDINASSIAAAIRLSEDEKYLYVTNRRGENTVAVFAVEGEDLTYLSSYPTEGREPRDFLLINDEKHALVTNQFGNSILLYRHASGVLTAVEKQALPAPLAVLEF